MLSGKLSPALLLFVLLSVSHLLDAQEPVPALETSVVAPVRFETHGKVAFADFGLDAYGRLRVILPEGTPPGSITIRLGEKLGADGAIDRHPPGSVDFLEWTAPVPAGAGVFEPEIPTTPGHRRVPVKTPPSVGEVAPFRYAEIENAPATLTADSLRQLFVHAPFRDDASAFDSSDATLNAVWALCKHTMKATTAFGVYIDGDRERKPYEADAYLNFLSHLASDADPTVGRRTLEYLLEHPTWPTEWSFHTIMLAAADYEATGDPAMATRHYDALKAKLLLEKARADGLLRAPGIVDWPPGERDGYDEGDPKAVQGQMVGPEINTVVNAFYMHALRKMAILAGAAGRPDDARDLTVKAETVSAAFQRTFYDPARGVYVDGEGSTHASLHANMCALAFGLVPVAAQGKVADFVAGRGMACSVYGAQYLLEALYAARRGEAALRLLTSHEDRGWWHMLDLGSTLTLEAWDARYKPNLTWNHAWGAAPANLIARFVLGVRPLEPGYRKILIAPQPGTLAWASGVVPTARGPVGIKVQTGPRFRLEAEIPPGATARMEMPIPPGAAPFSRVLLNGKPVAFRVEQGAVVVDPVPAGRQVLELSARE